MISAGEVKINAKPQLKAALDWVCGRRLGLPDTGCLNKVSGLYQQYTGDLKENERIIFDESFRIIHSQAFYGCLLKTSAYSGSDIDSTKLPEIMQCHLQYINGPTVFKYEGRKDSFEDIIKYLHDRAKSLVGINVAMVALPGRFKAYLDALRTKGAPYFRLANQAERLFREALAKVDSKKRAAAALEIAKEIRGWAEYLQSKIAVDAKKQEALEEAVSTYVYKVDKKDAHVADNSFIPEFKVAPAELFDAKALGFAGSDPLPLRARAELRRLFVEALIKLRKLKKGDDTKLVLLATKTADAVKDFKEDDDKIGNLGYKLIGVEVLKVLLKGTEVDKVVLRMRATMAGTPYKLLHLHDNRVGPSYIMLMRHIMAGIWDMVVEEVGASKLRRDKKLKKKLADSLIKRNHLDKLSPVEIFRLIVAIDGVDEKKGEVKTVFVPKELGELGSADLAQIYGQYAVLSRLKRVYRDTLKEAKDKSITRYDKPSGADDRAELALKITTDATDFMDKQPEGPDGVRFTRGTARWLEADSAGLNATGDFKGYLDPEHASNKFGALEFWWDSSVGGLLLEGPREGGFLQLYTQLKIKYDHEAGHFVIGGGLTLLSGIFPEQLAPAPSDSGLRAEEGNEGNVHILKEANLRLGLKYDTVDAMLSAGLINKRNYEAMDFGIGEFNSWWALQPTAGSSAAIGGRLDLRFKLSSIANLYLAGFASAEKSVASFVNIAKEGEGEKHVVSEGGPIYGGAAAFNVAIIPKSWIIGAAYHISGGGGRTVHTADAGTTVNLGDNKLSLNGRFNMTDADDEPKFSQYIGAFTYGVPAYVSDKVQLIMKLGAGIAYKEGDLSSGLPGGISGWGAGDNADDSTNNLELMNSGAEVGGALEILLKNVGILDVGMKIKGKAAWLYTRQGEVEQGNAKYKSGFFFGLDIGFANDFLNWR